MTRNVITLCFICITLMIQSCGSNQSVNGDGKISSKEYKISDYTSINLAGNKHLIYEQKGGKPYLRIETDKNLFNYIEVNTSNKTLSIDTKENINTSTFKIYTNSKELSSISSSGSCRIELIKEIKSNNLNISISGSGHIDSEKLNTKSLSISISGSGRATLNNISTEELNSHFSGASKGIYNGKAKIAKYSISGSGNIDALSLDAQSAKSSVSGSGRVSLSASDNLDISISGSGRVEYKGNAKVSQDISGSGRVTKL